MTSEGHRRSFSGMKHIQRVFEPLRKFLRSTGVRIAKAIFGPFGFLAF